MIRLTSYGLPQAPLFIIPLCAGIAIAMINDKTALALALLAPLLFVLNFFRDPERPIPTEAGACVSPADGQVTAVEEADMPWIGRCHRTSVFMNVFSVHVNRMPISGTVDYVERIPGKFMNAMSGEAATANERVLVGIKGDDGRKYLIVQIAGLIARNIVTPVEVGQHFERGQRFGMIKFGSRADFCVELDAPYRPAVEVGQWVKSASDILGHVDGGEEASG